MSAYDYQKALELRSNRLSALVMAALMSGRAHETERLRAAFPHIAAELEERRKSPDARTGAERDFDALEAPR